MRKKIFAALAVGMLVGIGFSATGCKPMTPEEQAAWDTRMAKIRAEQQLAARTEENNGAMELRGNDVYKAAQAAEAIMKENGYQTSAAPYKRGPGGGLGVTGTKTTDTNLGTSVGMNVLGNMLGADRGKIVKSHVDTTIVWVWPKWNANYTAAEPGVLLFANGGEGYDVTQANEKVNVKAMDTTSMVGLRDGIQARLK